MTQSRGIGGLLNAQFAPCTDVASQSWLKRREVQSILEGKIEVIEVDLNGTDVDTYLAQRQMEAFPHRTSPKLTLAEATIPASIQTSTVQSSPARSAVTESRPLETAKHVAEHVHRHRHHGRP